ncbi:MAG TPA: SUMF1/EgtB/PvdO family nonheme iron enzyme [Sedimentisphaerales bacterium]|nr:SUMF1/EgtB/PvdO family nonheme iron enzyme [Sedimentisphaerales bacterium]
MWRKILISFVVITISGNFALAECPSADLSGDCFVDFEDFAVMVSQWLSGGIPDDMVSIPPGCFDMGDHFAEGDSAELPVHNVCIVDSFYMSRYETTNRQYCDYLNSAEDSGEIKFDGGIVYASSDSYPYCNTHSAGAGSQIDFSGSVFSVRTKPEVGGRDMSDDPMIEVSWYGSVAYCNWRSGEEGKESCYNLSTWECDFSKNGYRLPTEAEWEYAARGGLSGRRFPWDDTIAHSQANYISWWEEGSPFYPYDMSLTEGYHPTWNDEIYPYTSPAGSFSANGYGLYDVAGNVWEWCNDWFSSTYYSSSPTNNPTGPTSGTYRVLRGGNWYAYAIRCRVACRPNYSAPDYREYSRGFRIVLPD